MSRLPQTRWRRRVTEAPFCE